VSPDRSRLSRSALQRLSLRFRLLVALLLAVAVPLATVALVVRGVTRLEFDRYVGRQRDDLRSIAEQLAPSIGVPLVLADRDGWVVAAADVGGPPMEHVVRPADVDVRGVPAGAEGFGVGGTRVSARAACPPVDGTGAAAGPEKACVVQARAPVPGPGEPPPPKEGLLHVIGDWEVGPVPPFTVGSGPNGGPVVVTSEELFMGSVSRALGIAVVAGGTAAVLLSLALARYILQPILTLTAAARRLERGDLRGRVSVRSRDEIGQLGDAFNAMADGLSRLERLRRTMVTDVAHELRTPLSNVRGYLEAMRDGVARPTPPLLAALCDQTTLLTRLLDDLQELTLAEAGQLTLAREPTDARRLAERAVEDLAPAAAGKGIQVGVAVPDDLPRVDADPNRVGQVLRNLLSNAITHTPAGGQIAVLARPQPGKEPGMVEISVHDTGVGIAPEHLPHVFERFYRADPSRARATGGTGIGLCIVKQLVLAHGGQASMSSTVGVGTTARFTLPVSR
jgi:signal transduction histidine kinase